jgi:APA family basic amino acid/polyamine antiporter
MQGKGAVVDKHGFVRALGLLDSTMIVVGSMIGSGIFIVAADIGRLLGSPGWLVLSWLLAGALTIMAAISYGELAAMMPAAGGQYVYLTTAYSPLWGFLYGWALFLVIQTGEIAAVSVAFARFCGILFPSWVGENHFIFNLGTLGPIAISFSTGQLAALSVIAVLTAVNLRGVREGKTVQNVFTTAKASALIGLIAIGFFFAKSTPTAAIHQLDFWRPRRPDGSVLSGLALMLVLGTALVGPLFSSDAWNNITFIASEVKEPRRNIPLALVLGVGFVTLLYVLANVAYLNVLSMPEIQNAPSDRVATVAMTVILGDRASWVMAAAIMVSTFGAVNGMILAGARVFFAMAQNGLFFERVGVLNRRGVPAIALLLQGLWSCLLVLPRTYDRTTNQYSNLYSSLLNYVVFVVLLFYALTVAGIIVLRRKQPTAERPYRTLGYPIIPIAYVILALLIALMLLIAPKTRIEALSGLIIVLSGLPAYWFWTRKQLRLSGFRR